MDVLQMSSTGVQRTGKPRILESKEEQLGPWGKEETKKTGLPP